MLLVGESGEPRVVSIIEARQIAADEGLDLVEINPNSEPPVCRLMDYGKFLFQQNKKKAVAKKKQKQVQTKELKYTVGIEEGDYQVKLRKIRDFILENNKVKISIRFRGRESSHQDLGFKLIDRLQFDVEPFASVEFTPRFEGRQIVMIIAPKKSA